jgi:tetratricopeptide (TPR) repeat protein
VTIHSSSLTDTSSNGHDDLRAIRNWQEVADRPPRRGVPIGELAQVRLRFPTTIMRRRGFALVAIVLVATVSATAAQSRFSRGDVYNFCHTSIPDDAIRWCTEYIKNFNEDLNAVYYWRGRAFEAKEKYSAAADDFSDALLYASEDPLTPKDILFDYNQHLGAMLFRNHDRRLAIDVLTRALSYRNVRGLSKVQVAAALTDRGVAYYELGDLRRAVLDLEEAFTLDPSNISAGVFKGLAERGILVRSFHESGGRLSQQLRITVGSPAENDELVRAWRDLA